MIIRIAESKDIPAWLQMRLRLWPHHTAEEFLPEMNEMLQAIEDTPVLIAFGDDQNAVGFLEGGTRKYADGCHTSPVGYIEGWYVEESYRRRGVGKALVQAFEAWCVKKGLSEIGSDTWVGNEVSQQAHSRLGYTVSERLVHFIKKI